MENRRQYNRYNSKAYIIIAQRDDGTYIGENGIDGELDRVYLYKPYKLFDELKELQEQKSNARFKLRSRSYLNALTTRVDAFTNPTSKNQYEWFFVREIVKRYNKENHLGCSNWRAYRLNSKHCPIKIDMELRRKMYERKIKYDNVEFFNPKFTLK